MPLKTLIKAEALKLGFVVCGVILPTQPETFSAYQAWIEAGFQADMGFLARPQSLSARQNPAAMLPGCRSILCVGLPYPAPSPSVATSQPGKGAIAAYALLPDYHIVLKTKLELLGARLSELAGRAAAYRACVDTAPILEKDAARRAGLGWIGRNSLLNAPGYGSYLFLGELLTDLELPPDAPLPGDPCANCRLCVDACPTQALRPNRSVDARRCLSYLTIEHRGAIPPGLRPKLGRRVFGCDTCQSVCPLNRGIREGTESKAVISGFPDLLEEFSFSEAEWKAKYRATPVMRAGFAGYRRNLAIALANSRPPGAARALQAALESERAPELRETLLWALAQLG